MAEIKHGYGAYTHGCRCEVCLQAKAAYIRGAREAAKAKAVPGVAVEGAPHGTRSGWELHGCRCDDCKKAQLRRHQVDYARCNGHPAPDSFDAFIAEVSRG